MKKNRLYVVKMGVKIRSKWGLKLGLKYWLPRVFFFICPFILGEVLLFLPYNFELRPIFNSGHYGRGLTLLRCACYGLTVILR